MFSGSASITLRDSFAEQKAAYRTYVVTALTLADWPEPEAAADAILAFETRIAEQHWTQVENRQIDKIYNPMTVAELAAAVAIAQASAAHRN